MRRANAQYEFLEVVRRLCPEPLCRLRDTVFPIYHDWTEAEKSHPEMIYRTFLLIEQRASAVARALLDWARTHSLIPHDLEEHGHDDQIARANSLWPLQLAAETLWAWQFWPIGEQMRNATPPEWVRVSSEFSSLPPVITISIRVDHWREVRESEADFRERAHAEFGKALDRIVEERRSFAELRGSTLRRGKREDTHFQWLALFQICGWNYEEIAKWMLETFKQTVQQSAIRMGIRAAAADIGLALRRERSGRRRN